MNVCVYGLWHLGLVTAGCLASAGHRVVGLDPDPQTIEQLQRGEPSLFEPGLTELLRAGLAGGHLKFTHDPAEALRGAQIMWVTFDTPVDENDRADVEFVVGHVERILPLLEDRALVLISSQLPVGTTRRLEETCSGRFPSRHNSFAYSPENLRLGKAIEVFTKPDRVVVGVRDAADRAPVVELLKPITDRIEWMSVESAEMVKHALNSFLAMSVTFINEVASLCEHVGADALEVERGLKSEKRIGPYAYLHPGGAFAGGTLARDVAFLGHLSGQYAVAGDLLRAIERSNRKHRDWAIRRLTDILDPIKGKTVSVLGLTYKPGTNTLRRSGSVRLVQQLARAGCHVRMHDPVVDSLPKSIAALGDLCASVEDALKGADAAVVATEWPEYRELDASLFERLMPEPVILDANRFLAGQIADRVRYYTVGKSS